MHRSLTQGWVAFRAGNFQLALSRNQAFERAPWVQGFDATSHHFSPSYFAIKSMTLLALGQIEAAKQAIADAELNREASLQRSPRWSQLTIWDRLIDEARQRIAVQDAERDE